MHGIVLRKNFASPKKLSLMHLFIYPWVNLCKEQPKLMYLRNITSLEVDNDRRWPLIACYSSSIVAAADYPKISDADWSIQIFF